MKAITASLFYCRVILICNRFENAMNVVWTALLDCGGCRSE